jgi:nucleoside-diphosphate-sugar epimerase
MGVERGLLQEIDRVAGIARLLYFADAKDTSAAELLAPRSRHANHGGRFVRARYLPVDEEHPLLPHDPYGLSKEVDGRTAAMFHRRTGMTMAALRFHYVAIPEETAATEPANPPDPAALANNLWGYVDVRDAGAACRLVIKQDGFGFGAFNITAADTMMSEPTEELVRRYSPETVIRAPLPGRQSGFSIDKAARLVSWNPRH